MGRLFAPRKEVGRRETKQDDVKSKKIDFSIKRIDELLHTQIRSSH
jgi:hypothetical protein